MSERIVQQPSRVCNAAASPFQGFDTPNFTPVPDEFLDEILPAMKSEAELKIILYAMRRTYGFKRDSDNISISQFLHGIKTRDGAQLDRGTGLSKRHLLKALDSLEKQGMLVRTRRYSQKNGDEATNYSLVLRPEWQTPEADRKAHDGRGLRPYKQFTPVLDQILDELLPDLTLGELKVLLYITRRTHGFKKDCASISRAQLLRGLRRSDGRVLDRGAGVSDNTLERVLKGLKEMNIIVTERQRSEARGDEPTSYSLNILNEHAGPPPQKVATEGGDVLGEGGSHEKNAPPGYHAWEGGSHEREPHKKQIRETVKRETEQQHHTGKYEASVVVVALVDQGVTRSTAEDLVRVHAAEHILAQMDMLPYRPADDPAAVLVKAIRDEWAPPAAYQTPEQREAEACDAERIEAEVEAWRHVQMVSRETEDAARISTRRQAVEFRPFDAIALDSCRVWATAVLDMKNHDGADAYLRGTRLLAREGDELVVGTGTAYAAEWLQRRIAHRAAQLLSAIGGEQVSVRFVGEAEWLIQR
ncbi:MAG: replication protein [Chloroflexota bacterium]|nr:replication protein [Chloroflexota bacterium]